MAKALMKTEPMTKTTDLQPTGSSMTGKDRSAPMRTRRLIGGFSAHQGGNIAIMFALMLPVIVGFIGLGIDVGMWYSERRDMQTATDAAAVSGAIERAFGATNGEITTNATAEAFRNGYTPATDTIAVNIPPTSGAFSGDTDYVEVIIAHPLDVFFASVISSVAPVSYTRAVATTVGNMDACVLSLAPSGSGITQNSALSNVSMVGCGVVANSSDTIDAVDIQNGALTVDCLWTVGGIEGDVNITTTGCDAPVSDATPIVDPYADLEVPVSIGPCNAETSGPGGSAYSPTAASLSPVGTLYPGVYCKGLTLTSDTFFMSPGTYYMDGGDFTVTGGAVVTGDNVSIIITDRNETGAGTFDIQGGTTVSISAPTDTADPWFSILLYQDRDLGTSPSMDVNLTGGSSTDLTGAVYIPLNDVSFSGGNTTDSNGCLMLVAQSVAFSGDADIDNNCDMYGGNAINFGAAPGLVE